MTNDYTLLRSFDAEAAKRGEPICTSAGDQRTYVYGPDTLGKIAVIQKDYLILCGKHTYRMAPLGWCEGKPVYVGDVLYHIDDGSEAKSVAFWGGYLEHLTWNPPQPKTKKVKLLGWLTYSNVLIHQEECGQAKTSGWKRVPSEDKEVEVLL